MTPTETLEHEHKVILLVLEAAERQVRTIQAAGEIDLARLRKFVEFFRNFVDRCHHAKEENHLFVMLQQRGMPAQNSPVAVLLAEHDQGRKMVAAIDQALTAGPAAAPQVVTAVTTNLTAYVQLLQAHIDKENNVLYPLANRLLNPADQQRLAQAFEKVEAEEMGAGVHEKYHQLAHELAEH